MAAEKQVASVILSGYGVIGTVLAAAIVRLKEEAAGRRTRVVLVPPHGLAEALRQVRRSHKQPTHIHVVGEELWEEGADIENARPCTRVRESAPLLEELQAARKEKVQVIRYAPAPLSDTRLAGLVQEVAGDVQPFEYFVLTSRPTLTAARQRTADTLAHSAGNAFFNELYRTAAFVCRVMPGRSECCAEVTDSLMQHLCSLSKETDLSPAMRRYRDLYRLYGRHEMQGGGAEMEELRRTASKVAAADDVRVLICGETGTGKGNAAVYVHLNSRRWPKPILRFSCATAPRQAERLLLGYRKNAFPGSTQDRKGLLEEAQGGTLYLDEVGDLHPETQALLLRVLEEKRILPLGAVKEVEVDVRLVASTNKDLRRAAAEGAFRPDLLYRLQEFTLHTPSLRQVREDIPGLANSLWRARNGQRLPEAAVPVLLGYGWPGNVRELSNFLKYAHIMGAKDWPALMAGFLAMSTAPPCPTPQEPVVQQDAAPEASAPSAAPLPLDEVLRAHVRHVLELCNGNQSRAAEHLGISRNTLRRYM